MESLFQKYSIWATLDIISIFGAAIGKRAWKRKDKPLYAIIELHHEQTRGERRMKMDRRTQNINMLHETLAVFEKGFYRTGLRKVRLQTTNEERRACKVYLPEEVKRICAYRFPDCLIVLGRHGVSCENTDSFTMARKLRVEENDKVLVLNFANPVNPGGGVHNGAQAQEEDLCRKSSLLLSLESEAAFAYYRYNRSLHTNMGSDAVIFSPKVEIIRDENGELLDKPVTVGVLTCAAPYIRQGLEGMSQEQYVAMLQNRIDAMLKCAAYEGYTRLVLGAWGCGAFGNDPTLMAALFYHAIKDFAYSGMAFKDFFNSVDFAVLDRTEEKENFKAFKRYFTYENFYRDEDEQVVREVQERMKEREKHLGKIMGSLVGGATGDALGYAVEFQSESTIFHRYGAQGITEYSPDPVSGKAIISDDTQMTLFTACGLLTYDTRGRLRGISAEPSVYVAAAYHDWLLSQEISFESRSKHEHFTWLWNVPELFVPRAPGNTCLSALSAKTDVFDDSKAHNNSKGCGGVMRVAPVGLFFDGADIRLIDKEAADIAAITHGHSLGYMPAAVMSHIIHRCVFPERQLTLCEIVEEARDTVAELYRDDTHIGELTALIDRAIELSANGETDLENIHRLGEGWVGEEALAIAIYCVLRYHDDFDKCIITAVNHKGDSDSTGAIAGNILGAWLGMDAIGEKWTRNLELLDVIKKVAVDLCHGCQMSEFSPY